MSGSDSERERRITPSSQARPMTMTERAKSMRDAMVEEKDPRIRGSLAESALRLRRQAKKRKSLKQGLGTAVAIGAVAAAPIVIPGAGKLASSAGEAAQGAAQVVGQRLEQALTSPESSIEIGREIGAASRAAREKEVDLSQPPKISTPTPSLWDRTAVPDGQEPTRLPRIDPTSTKKT